MWANLIAVTDSNTCPRPLEEQLLRICSCQNKPSCIILRAKELSPESYELLAKKALSICQAHQIKLLLHSDWQLALTLGVSCLQVPLPILRSQEFQEHRDSFLEIFTSIHKPEEVNEAASLGATALIAGHIYTTQCKEGLPPRGLDFLQKTCHIAAQSALPVYAIGGIKFSPVQFRELKAAGAIGACIMSGYMQI